MSSLHTSSYIYELSARRYNTSKVSKVLENNYRFRINTPEQRCKLYTYAPQRVLSFAENTLPPNCQYTVMPSGYLLKMPRW